MKRRSQMSSASQLLASIVLIGLLMFSTPALVGFVSEARANDTTPVSLNLTAAAETVGKVPEAAQEATAQAAVELVASQPKQAAPLPVPVAPKKTSSSRPKASAPKTSAKTAAAKPAGDELSRAKAILASMISSHPILAGSSVSFGDTPGSYQAVCYYKSGRILISPTHTASLDKIIRHEAWHIIDWRDNGVIDWGESVPR